MSGPMMWRSLLFFFLSDLILIPVTLSYRLPDIPAESAVCIKSTAHYGLSVNTWKRLYFRLAKARKICYYEI